MRTKEKNSINEIYNSVTLKTVALLKPTVYKLIKSISMQSVPEQLAGLAVGLQVLSEMYKVEPVELLALTEGIVHSGSYNTTHPEWQKLWLLRKEMEN